MSTKRQRNGGRDGSLRRAGTIGRHGREAMSGSGLHWWWFAVCLNAIIFYPGLWSATVWPKFLWVAVTVAAGWIFTWHNGSGILPRPKSNNRDILQSSVPSGVEGSFLTITPLGMVWTIYLAWALISLSWAPQPRVGLERVAILGLWSMAYLLAMRTRFWESARFWFAFQILFIFICMIGCVQFVLPGLPLFSDIPHSGLPSSTLGHRNYAAMYLAITIPFIAWRLYRGFGEGGDRRDTYPTLTAVALALGLAFLLFTRSRQAWIAIAVSVVFMLAAGGWKKIDGKAIYKRRTVQMAGLGILLLIVASLASAPGTVLKSGWRAMPSEKRSVIDTILYPFQRHGDPRLEMWIPALKILAPTQQPLRLTHGFGFGNFPIVSTPYTDSVRTIDYEIHNDYLQALLDLGLPGLILFSLFFGLLLLLAIRQKESGIAIAAGGAVAGLMVIQFFTFTSENVSPLAWMAGVAAFLNANGAMRTLQWRIPERMLTRTLRLARGAGAVFLVGMVFLIGTALWGERKLHVIESPVEEPDFDYLAREVLPWMQFNANVVFTQSHQIASLAFRAGKPEAAGIFCAKGSFAASE